MAGIKVMAVKKMSAEQSALAKKFGVSEAFLALLFARGLTEETIPAFLKPSLDDMCSPFSIDSMQVAVDRVRLAVEKQETVLIFGDYDCDGIGAIAILALYLRDKTKVKYFIPNRLTDGYGLNVGVLKNLIHDKKPDLVITVDCGITSVEEVDYLRAQGIDVIVTDHHEPQQNLPNCIVVNPKVKKEGFYDFCGAGVALKLVEALGGRAEMEKYLDIAAISTIADVVPLMRDNRVIAYFGLQKLLKTPRRGIKELLGTDKLTSSQIMFKLAPRINAAGRLGCAMKAVELFLEDDVYVLRALASELTSDNQRRQDICEAVVNDAKEMLRGLDFNSTRIIILGSENWEAGVLGIAAARLVEEFKCPALLFSKANGECRGSARSIKAINIFDELSAFSDLFISFGGHAQAAGVTLSEENFEKFKRKLNEIIVAKYDYTEFLPSVEYDLEILLGNDDNQSQDICVSTSEVPSFATELQMLEPIGYGNPQPSFLLRAEGFKFEKIGFKKHIKATCGNLEIMGFGKFDYSMCALNGKVDIEMSLGLNCYQNRVYPQGIIKTFTAREVNLSNEDSFELNLYHLEFEGEECLPRIDVDNAVKFLEKPFGTLFVCFDVEEYNALASKSDAFTALPILVATPRCLNPQNCVIVCPSEIFDFGYYQNVIIAGKPLSSGFLNEISKQVVNCYVLETDLNREREKVQVSDEQFRAVYVEMRKLARERAHLQSEKRFYQLISSRVSINREQFALIRRVFKDLGLISVGERGIIEVGDKKTSLSDCAVYRNLRR